MELTWLKISDGTELQRKGELMKNEYLYTLIEDGNKTTDSEWDLVELSLNLK